MVKTAAKKTAITKQLLKKLTILIMERVYSNEVKNHADEEILLKGWVDTIRALGKISFVIIRDRFGKIQTLAKADSPIFEKLGTLSREDVVEAVGTVKANSNAPGGAELQLKSIEVLNPAEPIPIEFSGKIETNMSKRLDYRYIDLRNPQTKLIFELKSEITNLCRKFLHKQGFLEMHTPKIVSLGAEGGSEQFPILYYDK